MGTQNVEDCLLESGRTGAVEDGKVEDVVTDVGNLREGRQGRYGRQGRRAGLSIFHKFEHRL